jgi:outer membrane immunogenic protein
MHPPRSPHTPLAVRGDPLAGQRNTFTSSNFVASTIAAASANLSYRDEQKLNWLATVRPRLGWTYDCFLWYVTGGVAFGEVESNLGVSFVNTAAPFATNFGSGTAAASSRTTKTGWTVGGGVETSLAWVGWSPNWSAKLEYLYVDLGSVSNSVTAALGGGTQPAPTSATLLSSHDIRDHIIRVGVNYRFRP